MTLAAHLMPVVSPSWTDWRCRLGLFAGDLQFAMHVKPLPDTLAVVREATCDADADDLRQARIGDGDAFARIIRRHQQEIARRLRRFSRDPLVLEELVQETFVQAYFSLHRFRGDAPLIHWLHRIAVRAGYRFWRSRHSKRTTVSIERRDRSAAEKVDPDDTDAEMLDCIMSQLSPRDRLVLSLMYLDGRTVAEIAQLTGWSGTMVKVQAFRARGRLKKLMERQHGGQRR